jgi:hypothetical protein
MSSQDLHQQLLVILAKAEKVKRDGLWEEYGSNRAVRLREPNPVNQLLQYVHDVQKILQDSEKSSDIISSKEAGVILEEILGWAEEMAEKSENENRRMERLIKRLGG